MKKEITVIVNKLSTEVDNFNYAIFEDYHEKMIEQVNEIAENFAIDFAKWCFKNFDMTTTIDELLEIYKKEKQRE